MTSEGPPATQLHVAGMFAVLGKHFGEPPRHRLLLKPAPQNWLIHHRDFSARRQKRVACRLAAHKRTAEHRC
jgi:hypothetical protein